MPSEHRAVRWPRGVVYQGEPSIFRNGERRGERYAALGRGRLPCAKPVSDPLDRLAELAGVEPGYQDVAGVWHETPPETKRALLAAMRLDSEAADVAIARLEALPHDEPAALRCVTRASSDLDRGWGVTCQVYGLRSPRNAGVGDLEDVALLAERLAAAGADFLGLSPLHALFPEAPERCSPYRAISSRRWLNELLIAVDVAASDLGLPAVEQHGADQLRRASEIDWPVVATTKRRGPREAVGSLLRAASAQ